MAFFLVTIPVVVLVAAPLILLVLLLRHLVGGHQRRSSSCNLPPGNLGYPVVGQTFSLIHAFRRNADEEWFRDRVRRYGPVSKMSVLGSPTVLLVGPAANRFIFGSDGLALTQTTALSALVGRSVLTFAGDELKQVRAALQGYLRPEMVRRYVGTMDQEVRRHIELCWVGRKTVTVFPLASRVSLSIICSVIFGDEAVPIVEALAGDFVTLGKAVMSFPVNIPFSRFSKGMRASRRIRAAIRRIAHKRKESWVPEVEGCASSSTDFITYMLNLHSQGAHTLTLEDIVDNAVGLIVGAHGTTSVLVTFMIRHLAAEADVLDKVTQEQEEIASSKLLEDSLTWEDVVKMKYTWKVAMETLRTVPPVFGSFRTATKDIEYQGYHIPKGWKVFAAQSITHMDGKFFDEPMKFDPSRFEKSIPPYCFMPFGGGPRMCPGNVFARAETMVVMHYIVRRFRWKMLCQEEAYTRDPKPTPVLGLPIELWLRRPIENNDNA